MSSGRKKPSSIFPDLPREKPVVDKDGNFTGIWSLGLASLFQALQKNFSNEGIIFPNLDSNSINYIQSLYASYIGQPYSDLVNNLPDISGKTVFDTTNRVSKQFVIAFNNLNIVILAEWVPISIMKQGNVDPNGNQAGLVGWQYYDSSNNRVYVCSNSGNSSTAIWIIV